MKSSEPPLSFHKLDACFFLWLRVGGPCFYGGQFGFRDGFRKNLTVFQVGFHIYSFPASLARYVAVGMLWILAVCGFLGYGMLCS